MLIKTKPTAIAIKKVTCTAHCLSDLKHYLVDLKQKGLIDLTINKDWFIVEGVPHQLYTILFTLSINYDIELM